MNNCLVNFLPLLKALKKRTLEVIQSSFQGMSKFKHSSGKNQYQGHPPQWAKRAPTESGKRAIEWGIVYFGKPVHVPEGIYLENGIQSEDSGMYSAPTKNASGLLS